MFKLFKRKNGDSSLRLTDMEGQDLKAGDTVLSMRYELGECKVVKTEKGIVYESLETGKQVHWLKMVDAHTRNQKVKKLD